MKSFKLFIFQDFEKFQDNFESSSLSPTLSPHIPTNPRLPSRIIVLFRALEERLKKVNITKSSRFFYFLQAKFKYFA